MKFNILLFLFLSLYTFSVGQDVDLRLYGTASQGGTNTSLGTGKSYGTLFSMNQDGTDFIKLHDFDSINGMHPGGTLTMLSDGRLAGVTWYGGEYNHGVLYTINRDGSDLKVLKHFVDTRPSRGVLLASDGLLYGATGSSTTASGVIYRINPDGTGYTELAHFDPLNFGSDDTTWDSPTLLLELPEGDLVGATSYGTNGFGFVFRMPKEATSFSTLYTCTYEVGGSPVGIILASDGLLYLTTQAQGGSILSMKTDGSDVKEIFKWPHSSGAIGYLPHWGITESKDGDFYGTTMWHSELLDSSGVVFKINKDGSDYTPLYIADDKAGSAASYGVTIGSNNRLFTGFMTGGQVGVGTIVSMNHDGTDFKLLKSFDYESGAIPGIGNLILAPPPGISVNETRYLTLTGSITKPGGIPLTMGQAGLFFCKGGLAARATVTNGKFKIDSLRQGKYFLQIVPNGNEGSEVFPTYYLGAKLHTKADTLYLKGNSTIAMELLPKQSKEAGQDKPRVTGRVVSDNTPSSGRLMSNQAMADLPVYLLDEKGAVTKDITVTDSEGYFKFNGTSDGTYLIALDIVGSNLPATSSQITLNSNIETMDITARVTQQNTIGVEYSVNVITGVTEMEGGVRVYPNPVTDKMVVQIPSGSGKGVYDLTIHSVSGKVVKQFMGLQITSEKVLEVSELPAGLYLLQIAFPTGGYFVKFIKRN